MTITEKIGNATYTIEEVRPGRTVHIIRVNNEGTRSMHVPRELVLRFARSQVVKELLQNLGLLDAAEQGETAKQVERLRAALTKINGIRNSIVGAQAVNWSEHIYPLFAALNDAGFAGESYETARENLGTLLERAARAEAEVERLSQVVRSVAAEQGET